MTEALVGLTIPTSGRITIAGSDVTTLSTDAVLDLGVGYVPEDRLHDGLVGDFSVAENLVLDLYDQPPFASGPAMNLAAIARNATERVDEFDVRTPRRPPRPTRSRAATSRRWCSRGSCRGR